MPERSRRGGGGEVTARGGVREIVDARMSGLVIRRTKLGRVGRTQEPKADVAGRTGKTTYHVFSPLHTF
jgi:hypothetical protein